MVDPIISVVKESTDLDITEIRSPNDFSEDFISIQFQQRKTMFKINSSQLESLQHQFVNDVQLIVEDSVHEMERELELATESVVWQLHILDSEIVDLNKAKEHLRDFKNSINSFTSGLIARISSVNGEGSRGELFLSNDSRAASNDEVKEMEKINNNNQSTSVQFNELHRIVSDCLTALSPYRSNHPSFQLPLVTFLFSIVEDTKLQSGDICNRIVPKLLGDLGSEIKSLRVSQQIYKICKEDTLRFINSATSILRISSSEVTSCEQNHTVERDVGNITYAVVEAGCDFSSPHTLEDHPDVNSDKLMDVGYNCDLFRDDENDTRMNGTKIIPDTNGSEIALKAKRPIHEMSKVTYPKLSGNKSGISSTDSKSMQHFAFDF